MRNLIFLMLVGAAGVLHAERSVSDWSPPAAVDMRESSLSRVILPAKVTYDPAFATGILSDTMRSEVLMLEHYATYSVTTQRLVSVTDDPIGGVSLTSEVSGKQLRFVLNAYEGEALKGTVSADVGFGFASPFSASAFADTTTNKLQRVVDEGEKSVAFLCDTVWAAGTASAVLTKTRTPWLSKRRRGEPVVTEVAKLEAPYAGAYNYAIPQYEGAEYVFSLIFKDGDGNQIGEPYNAEYTIRCDFGSLFLLR